MSHDVLAAPDKFRGSLDAIGAAQAIAAGAAAAGWGCVRLPLADGGEGTLDVFGGGNRTTPVSGPLGRTVEADWRLDGEIAVVEMARASGLALVGGAAGNDPVAASTRGTGELIAEAVRSGATEIVVGVGGSATTDGGAGALEALADLLPFPEHGLRVRVACDVGVHFADAATVFGPQKGATPDDVPVLVERLHRLAGEYRTRFGVDVAAMAGAGAAGGLAGGLAAGGATLEPGFDLVAGMLGLDDAIAAADLVITGEGRLDETSFAGKVVGSLAARCADAGIGVVAVVGDAAAGVDERGLPHVSLVGRFGLERALSETAGCISTVVEELLRSRG
jgi:glycerate kinase